MSSFEDRPDNLLRPYLTRRAVVRGVGVLGLGTLGMALPGCKNRPDEDIIDTSTDPELVQLGGTISGTVTGLFGGAAVAAARVQLGSLGEVSTDRDGRFEVRAQTVGDFPVTVTAAGHHPREGIMRLDGNVVLALGLAERDAGVSMRFLDEYVRAAASARAGLKPRTPGFSNRWLSQPQVFIYRKLLDEDGGRVPDERLAAMQAAVQSLFGPLTGYRLGSVTATVRTEPPPADLSKVGSGIIACVQSRRQAPRMEHGGAVGSPWAIGRAWTECRVDSPIELFNRMFAHTLGAWLVTAEPSIVNPAGLAAPTDADLLAARFLYARQPGNEAPDTDPPGVYLNA